MRRWKLIFFALAGFAVLVILVLGALHLYKSGTSITFGVTIATALLSMLALANSALGSIATDDRVQFANAFAIARRWEEKPIADARNVIRAYLSQLADLEAAAIANDDVKHALIDFLNFFWDMAAAVELNWADPRYLRLRFSISLETLYPAMVAVARNSPDKSADEAIRSIDVLRKRWSVDPFKAQ